MFSGACLSMIHNAPPVLYLPDAQPVLKPDLQSEVLDLDHICQASVCCLWRMTRCSDLIPSLLLVTSFCCAVDTGYRGSTNRQRSQVKALRGFLFFAFLASQNLSSKVPVSSLAEFEFEGYCFFLGRSRVTNLPCHRSNTIQYLCETADIVTQKQAVSFG